MLKEIPFKEWKAQEATRLGITLHAVEVKLSKKLIPYPRNMRRVNSRVILVPVYAAR